ncbi:hypothetical protein GA0061101_16216 [Rhizobium lusitanum]|uniref:Uncharacterized protein n=1 Tax=Rhizobium lusitanum TaxID=293958 RepID=A0A1C3XM39_9HYPH|nr:hypothetical protein GA0061101_16216 [Rhizobium lusitanum]
MADTRPHSGTVRPKSLLDGPGGLRDFSSCTLRNRYTDTRVHTCFARICTGGDRD